MSARARLSETDLRQLSGALRGRARIPRLALLAYGAIWRQS